MSGRCVELREISSRGREMATSGGEREKRQAWTHDINPPLKGTASRCSRASNKGNGRAGAE